MFIEKTNCYDDGCSVSMFLEKDLMALKMEPSDRIEAQYGQQCKRLDGKKYALAKVKLAKEFWDPAGTSVCRVKKIELLMP